MLLQAPNEAVNHTGSSNSIKAQQAAIRQCCSERNFLCGRSRREPDVQAPAASSVRYGPYLLAQPVLHADCSFVMICVLRMTYPNGCWHQFIFLPRLRPCPVKGALALVYHSP